MRRDQVERGVPIDQTIMHRLVAIAVVQEVTASGTPSRITNSAGDMSITPVGNLLVTSPARLGDGTTNYVAVGSTGTMTYAGSARPKRTLVLTASGALLGSTQPTRTATTGTNVVYTTLDYTTSSQMASWNFAAPNSFDDTTPVALDVTVYWKTATVSGTTTWNVSTIGIGNNVNIDTAGNTLSTLCTASATASNVNICSLGTIVSQWGKNKLVYVTLKDTTGTAPTASALMVKLQWTASAEGDN